MKITVFGFSDLNPYLELYKRALESQGLIVDLVTRFGVDWLLTQGRSSQAIHLHWVETAYEPYKWHTPFKLLDKVVNYYRVKPFRQAVHTASFLLGLVLAKLQSKTIVYTVHNLESHRKESRTIAWVHRLVAGAVVSLADRIHVHNQYTRRMVENTYRKKKDIRVIPLGNYVGYYPNTISRSSARDRLQVPQDVFVYLFLGLIRPYKGVEELLHAYGTPNPSESQLLIVGRTLDDDYEQRIRMLVGDNPAIRLVPEFVPDEEIQFYVKACDVCVLPYRRLTTSSAAILAMSFGRPVIAPAIASFPELLTQETGILYDPVDPAGLASAMEEARQRRWTEKRILADMERFDWISLGPQLADLYHRKSRSTK